MSNNNTNCTPNQTTVGQIMFNNADEVLECMQSPAETTQRTFFTMVQGNTYSDVVITDRNIQQNSKFIADMWD